MQCPVAGFQFLNSAACAADLAKEAQAMKNCLADYEDDCVRGDIRCRPRTTRVAHSNPHSSSSNDARSITCRLVKLLP